MRDPAVSATPGATVWLTGLSGAGKSTIAEALAEQLRAEDRRVEVLDGDVLRQGISQGLGFSREDRDTHVRRAGFVASLLSRNGVLTLVPVIAPYAESRAAVRERHASDGTTYVEVYLSTPVEECRRRDVKGLYAQADAGAITPMTGAGDPYEPPTDPDLTIDTTGRELSDVVHGLRTLLHEKGLL
ncbi:adenylyl-sulfate kinase [Arsenicicoccus piscis]|uniref:Adenylyl-sulfate kinase n=1 Tax=Arsenicicoccus piscis TaxID=673954 RepID=A0ABQ6HRU0_9MICO|nr:adenylyl-sulfate kinase [Arsenicicoccus piscis]